MPLLPVAMYGLEVPPGDVIVPALVDFPATFRITMAAIDPSEPAEIDAKNGVNALRSTLKILRQPIEADDDDEEDSEADSDDEAYMRALLAEDDSDEDDESENNGAGPSDPSKSKKARKQAAIEELLAAVQKDEESDDEEMEDVDTKVSKKGKAKATADDEEDDESGDEDEEDDEDLEIEEFVICTLDQEKNYQQTLDITIGEDERVFFKVTGSHTVFLTGNYLVPDDDGHNHHHEVYDSDDEDDEDYDLSPDEDELELDLLDDESDDLDDLEDPRITEVDSGDDVPALVSDTKASKKGKNKRAAEEPAESLDDMIAAAAPEAEQKLSKKQLKKQKNNKGEAVATKEDESKDSKKVQFAKNLEQGPSGSDAKPAAAAQGTLAPRTVKGVKIDDKKIGTGPACKNNDRVGMRYIGKLLDGKVFDSNKKGKPFSFKLGKGEVIQGWDIGVLGMAVGGERRLTIPPKLAYGSKGMPGIPANSTLVFDIKLLEIK